MSTVKTKEEKKPRYRVRFAKRGCLGTIYYKIEKRSWFFWRELNLGFMTKPEVKRLWRVLIEEDVQQ